MKFWVKRFRRFIWGHFRFVGWSNKGDFKRLRNKLHDQSWDLWKIWSSKKWSTLIVFFSPSDETCIWIQRKYEIIALGSDRNFRILMIINKFIQKSIFLPYRRRFLNFEFIFGLNDLPDIFKLWFFCPWPYSRGCFQSEFLFFFLLIYKFWSYRQRSKNGLIG